jgi:transposase
MSYILGVDRNETMLLPATVEDYVSSDNPVRAIDAFVEALDLEKLRFAKSKPSPTGRPPYQPADLLKLFLWGYLNRVCSSRRLVAECKRNLELMWLLRLLDPCFKTVADFRRQNAVALKGVFRQFAFLCREVGLFGRELVAIDGTKLKASNNPAKAGTAEQIEQWLKAMDERMEQYLAELDRNDATELAEAGQVGDLAAKAKAGELQRKIAALRRRKQRSEEALVKAKATGAKVPLIDPECQSMKGVGLGYNAQIAVDGKHHLIAVAEIAQKPTDHVQLPVIAEKVCQSLGTKAVQIVADGGYHDRVALAEAEQAGIECYVPQPHKGHAETENIYHKSAFIYEAENDAYRCPAGKFLERRGAYLKHGDLTYAYTNPEACRQCAIKTKCTKGPYRRIERWENEVLIEVIADRVAAKPEIIRKRKALVEHPFGTIKFWRAQGAVLTRGRRQVQAELSLSALAYNLTRVLAVLGVQELIKAIAACKGRLQAACNSIMRFWRLRQAAQFAPRLGSIDFRWRLPKIAFEF